jgi:DNA-binding SARP family transcriptional activator
MAGRGQTCVLRWSVLGTVGLDVDGSPVELKPGKQRCVAAALLMTPGQLVPVATLVDRVWDDRPPRSPAALAPFMTRLRRTIDAASAQSAPGTGRSLLRFDAGGYLLDCEPDTVDLHRARRLAGLARARLAAGSDRCAADLLREALTGWEAETLAGVPGAWGARTRESLQGERIELVGELAEINIRLGRHSDVVEELRPLVTENPGAEVLVSPYLRALVALGRSGDALALYATVRRALAERLGAEPSAQLRELHVRILRDDVAPDAPGRDAAGAVRSRVVAVPREAGRPAQLPSDVSGFTGRDGELLSLTALAGLRSGAGAVPVSVVSGMAGVGKSALAVHWAHRARREFPDGQLYVDLRGYDSRRPLEVRAGLAGLLLGLGVTEADLPAGVTDRAASYRSEAADRRLLVLLDNAGSAEQVRPLLPGSGSCVVIVTSRHALPGLVSRDGATRVELDVLPDVDAHRLLRALTGDCAAGCEDALAALTERCARLPLALRLTAEIVAARPRDLLRPLVSALETRPLDVLTTDDDPRSAIREVFSWSLRRLSPEVTRVFVELGRSPDPRWDVPAVAAIVGAEPEQAASMVETLWQEHLLRPVSAGGGTTWDMNPLLRAYARELPAPAGISASPRAVVNRRAIDGQSTGKRLPAR